ncbi:MAG TPA: radical SAM protein [Verrucomicrobiae bacterium]|nr:radical SAM protein [Verrucomicrobiae bacterium]
MNKLDLLLINPGGRELIYQDLGAELSAIEPPLWCRLLAGYVYDRGYSVDILDSEAENKGPQTIARDVIARQPRLVGMVVFGHQPSASTQQMTGATPILRAIKELDPEQKIILVGGHVSALPERTMTEEAVDFACNSEGPVTVHELLQALDSGFSADFSKVAGLVWREEGHIRQNLAPPLIKDLDSDLHGNAWHLLPMSAYRAHNWQCFGDLASRKPYASIYTTLGCPYKCSFCCINAPFGTNRYRMRQPEKVVEEVDHLYHTFGVKTFKIIDEMFVLNDRHVSGICERLAAKPYASELNFWAYARVDTVRPERLQLLRSAGIRWLALGIESGSEHVRDGAEKSLDAEDIVNIVRSIKDAGIYVIGNYIFGLPDDDLASMQQTLDLAQNLNCEFANFYSAMAYPGSPLYTMAVNNGWKLPERWSGFSQHSYDCLPLPTERVSAADVLRFRDRAFHEYFENPIYLNMVSERFGRETRRHIEEMTRTRLRRALLESDVPGAVRTPAFDSSGPFSIVST